MSYNGQLYLSSVYPQGTSRTWNDNALRGPHVRIKIGNDLYDRTLSWSPIRMSSSMRSKPNRKNTLS